MMLIVIFKLDMADIKFN